MHVLVVKVLWAAIVSVPSIIFFSAISHFKPNELKSFDAKVGKRKFIWGYVSILLNLCKGTGQNEMKPNLRVLLLFIVNNSIIPASFTKRLWCLHCIWHTGATCITREEAWWWSQVLFSSEWCLRCKVEINHQSKKKKKNEPQNPASQRRRDQVENTLPSPNELQLEQKLRLTFIFPSPNRIWIIACFISGRWLTSTILPAMNPTVERAAAAAAVSRALVCCFFFLRRCRAKSGMSSLISHPPLGLCRLPLARELRFEEKEMDTSSVPRQHFGLPRLCWSSSITMTIWGNWTHTLEGVFFFFSYLFFAKRCESRWMYAQLGNK